MEQKIVVNLRSGAVHKGVTHDFSPNKEAFHVLPAELIAARKRDLARFADWA